jgi:hypothetical protein
MMPQSPRAKTEGWIASVVVELLCSDEDEDGISLTRR